MRVVSWNVRGLGANIKVATKRRVVRNVRANFCFIQESKLEIVSRDLIRKIWSNDNFNFRFTATRGRSGGIILVWDKDCFQVTGDPCVERAVVVEGKWKDGSLEDIMINVYAPNAKRDQRAF